MRLQLSKRLAALEQRLSPNDLSRLSNDELENLVCAKFDTCDRYAVVVELALSDSPAEGSWVTRRIIVEVQYRHHSVAGGIELERWFCLGHTNASSNERGNQA
jgi:hypothetical protein